MASDTARALTLPVWTIPSVVLPGTVATIALESGAAASLPAAGGQVLLLPTDLTDSTDLTGHGAGGDPAIDTIGVVARVPNTGSLPNGNAVAIVQAEARARVLRTIDTERSGRMVEVEVLDEPRPTPRVESVQRELRVVLTDIAELRRSRRLPELLRTAATPGALADGAVAWGEADADVLRQVLATVDVADRLAIVLAWATDLLAELRVEDKIRTEVTEGMEKNQKEFLLRQQLAAIRKELGEDDDDVAAGYRSRVEALGHALPTATRQAIDKELDRLERLSAQSPETGWVRNWLDRVLDLPWGQTTQDVLDLDAARGVLDADHHGLDDVKDRIVELLAVRKLRSERGIVDGPGTRGAGAIVTLVGPPGVGKTSLGESIARAMGRSFVRVALGGVRDEAEIRGHRRTYVGSQPGRIVRALTEAGTMNPVVLLDEVDKLSAGGWSGDPTAALLEVLDPAQNHTFRDHYLEVDLDLSQVVFIATANTLDTVPAPLLDRMEIVRLDGYTEDEKTFIATAHLWPRQVDKAGLRSDEVVLAEGTVAAVVTGYTREAGVRSLERQLAKLARKVAAAVAIGRRATPVEVRPDDVREWLGRPPVHDEVPERTSTPGVATGLAVTGAGGDVLFVEVTGAVATGQAPTLTLTGQLGDVMKESAQIALSYVSSHAAELGVDPTAIERRFHVHVPAGAVPKDGPSAGITMATALVSLLTDRPVKSTVGMTGEITLQGSVLPIGGVKQKVLAAHRAGLTEVVLPRRNGADLEDVPERVREAMTFHLADSFADVMAVAFASVGSPSTG